MRERLTPLAYAAGITVIASAFTSLFSPSVFPFSPSRELYRGDLCGIPARVVQHTPPAGGQHRLEIIAHWPGADFPTHYVDRYDGAHPDNRLDQVVNGGPAYDMDLATPSERRTATFAAAQDEYGCMVHELFR